ncbi:MAG: response regulator [Candidatus Aminicenantes bacterium]|nr:response regulator [Candidatus Aminicenantes bacterium]
MNSHKKGKILVVDDDITVCKSISQAISIEGYDVDTALSGEEALKKDMKSPYDLIITDLMMPGISGLELLKSLKPRRPDVKLIMVTGYPTIKTAVESIKIGAFDYIAKPFTPQDIRSVIHRALKTAKIEPKMAMPPGLYYISGHTWLRREEKSRVTVGITADYLQTIGDITRVELPSENQSISQGEVCAHIEDDNKFVHPVWSPITGRILEINTTLLKNFQLLSKYPYDKAWLFRVKASNLEEDIKGLKPSE